MYHTQVAWPYQSSAVPPQLLPEGAANPMVPRMDIFETRQEVVYVFEMPGINTEQLEVEIRGRNIFVSAPVLGVDPHESVYRYQERTKGKLARTVSVTPDVDIDRVKAEIGNGLLELRFMKVSENTLGGRKIPVQQAYR